MKLVEYFKQFIGSISLNPTRVARIDSALSQWETLLKNDEKLEKLFVGFHLQGSYAINTGIKPKGGDEFDVDTVLILALEDDQSAKATIDQLDERARSHEGYDIIKKDRCVRINYAGDFHLDIVPAKPTSGEQVYIPDRTEDEWIESNPIGFTSWCKVKGSQFARVVKMLKRWRDTHVGASSAPKSILLTTLAGHHFRACASDAESLVLTLEEMVAHLDDYLVDGEPQVDNPSLPGENLARDWSRAGFDVFKKKLTKFAEGARDALDEGDKDKSIEKWCDVLGDEFPRELPQAAGLPARVAAGAALVGATGRVGAESGQPIRAHRFYGCKADE